MNKHAVLVLAHSDVSYIFAYAKLNPSTNFYIHMDSKSGPISYDSYPSNVHFLPDHLRHSVTWAGFSMIEATNELFTYALKNEENTFFHLISGSDVILQPLNNFKFDKDFIYMNCIESPTHRYRVRFNTPHADTSYQRSILGKSLTFAFKIFDKAIPTKKGCLFGSQWFSIHRNHLRILIESIDKDYNNFFKNKLCPDEHYYQYLVYKNNLQSHLSESGNKRYIIFDKKYNNGNNPIFLSLQQLDSVDIHEYWFARKAKKEVINSFLKQRFL